MTALTEQQLLAANVNPRTRLATDYLNLFNEAIMLFEMALDMPELVEEMQFWEPRSYTEHFEKSGFEHKDVVIAAYLSAEPSLKSNFDTLCDESKHFFEMAIEAISSADLTHDSQKQEMSDRLGQMKNLVIALDSQIHGRLMSQDEADQASVDALF